jgi:hypothetical protein
MFARHLSLCGIALAIAPPLHAAVLSISGVKSQTVGTTAIIPGSGDSTNTTTWTAATVGEFLLKDAGNNLYGLRVTASNPTGRLTPGTDSLMVARTVNSQGLTDTGTLSVYVRPTGTATAANAPVQDGAWTLDLNFSFFNVADDGSGGYNFTTPFSTSLLLTSLDIDYNQKYYTSTGSFTTNMVYTGTTITTIPGSPAGYSGFTATGNSLFSDPTHAVSSKGTGSSFDTRIAHDKVALFMFEFRDPSAIVPEPSAVALLALSSALLLRRKRRG